MADPRSILRDELLHLAEPIYRFLHPHAEPVTENEIWAPGQPGPNDPGLARTTLRNQQNLGSIDNLRATICANFNATLLVTGLARGVSSAVSMPIGPNGAGFLIAAVNDRQFHTFDLLLGAGQILEALNVSTLTGLNPQALIYVRAERTRVLDDGTISSNAVLIGQYITNVHYSAGWPGQLPQSHLDGEGAIFIAQSANAPPPFTEVFIQVPIGARWEVLNVNLRLTTSAVAGFRVPLLALGAQFGAPSFSGFYVTYAQVSQVAAETRIHSFSQGLQLFNANVPGFSFGPLPANNRLSGANVNRISTSTIGMDAADQYTGAPPLWAEVREWLDPP